MAIAYFDCFAGAGGDMIVAALLDAGADLDELRGQLSCLDLEGYSLRTEMVTRGGIAGRRFIVDVEERDHPHRHLSGILALIDGASLPQRPADRARRIFTRLAQAESQVHNITIEQVHFHEVGAVDSIVDVVAACLAMELLHVERIYCSPIALGSGTIECSHGTLPVPAPATARLVVGASVVSGNISGEATTPTAAGVLTTLAESYGPAPAMTPASIGHGAGTRESGPLPNLLRVYVGEPDDDGAVDSVVELSANLDDCSGEIVAATIDALLAGGSLDAWATPVVMKKSRPAWVLSVLCRPADVEAAERIVFSETTTFGIRRHTCRRSKLERTWQTVETPYGPIRVKLGRRGGRTVTASPEFSDCLSAAQAHGTSAKEVYQAAAAAWRQGAAQ